MAEDEEHGPYVVRDRKDTVLITIERGTQAHEQLGVWVKDHFGMYLHITDETSGDVHTEHDDLK